MSNKEEPEEDILKRQLIGVWYSHSWQNHHVEYLCGIYEELVKHNDGVRDHISIRTVKGDPIYTHEIVQSDIPPDLLGEYFTVVKILEVMWPMITRQLKKSEIIIK